ncbi:MAG: biopolymer transporter ExbD [Lentisphaeria bacterium]|jgi:biopolymer transport protein ExbD|nr:biopolymer transporter ExbD [Lentisphaeria bacterium]MDY0176879.1 biopolymer transporter ExbD [Lentisphaeria bacterium]NLZ60087.1 biopolymer transporter ExbD [Lentisphaerota bacterium]
MNFKRQLKDNALGFQMAPMLDIIFILLILFMVANIFAQWENKLGIQVPSADSGLRVERQPGEVIINIDREGDIYINSKLVTAERLQALLLEIADAFKSQPVILRADKDTRHQDVIRVLDICRKADIWNVAFSTLAPEEAL